MAQQRRRAVAVFGALMLLAMTVAGLGLFAAAGQAADEERGILADLISRALSTPASRVTIGRIDGALSSNATVYDIVLQDRDGPWLKLDRVRIAWRRLALIQRRLEIDDLDLGQLTMLRRPVPAEHPVAAETQPLLPDLPVKVDVKQFALAEMVLGAPVLGFPARFSTGGYGTLGPPSEGLTLHLDAQRLDRPASLTVRLALVPQTQRLTLAVALDEPAGGLVSTLAAIPGEPPVKLALNGDGVLDDFAARLAFDAGPEIGATGSATLKRQGAARGLALDLSARVAGLLPAAAAPVFAGDTTLRGHVAFGDDRSVTIEGVALEAALARLDIAGGIDPAGAADVTLKVANRAGGSDQTAVGEAVIRRLAVDARLTGPLGAPTIRARLALEGARLPAGAVDRLEARFAAFPGAAADAPPQLEGEAHATGLALANPALAQAIGRDVRLSMHGTGHRGGGVDVAALDLAAETLALHYAGRVSSAELAGQLQADLPDLARFGPAAGLSLRGAAHLSATLEGTPRANRFVATLAGTTQHLATGLPALDGLFGETLTVSGGLRLDPDGGFGADRLVLAGPHATATVDGAVTPALADMTAVVAIPDLAAADRRLAGRGDGTVRLTGTLQALNAEAHLGLRDGRLLGRPVPRLDAALTATDLRGQPEARLTIGGEVDHKPARAALHLRRAADGTTAVDGLDAAIGSVSATGGVTLAADGLLDGALAIKAGNLDDLSPLVLQRLAGSLAADLTLARAGGGQDATIRATGRQIQFGADTVDRLTADLRLRDAFRHPVLDGTLTADTAKVAGETISGLRLLAKGSPAGSDLTLQAAVRGLALSAAARLVPADPIRLELARAQAVRGRDRITLAAPATLVLTRQGVDIKDLALASGGGRLSIAGHAGAELRLKAEARAVPLAAADVLAPGLGATGTLDGEATLAGAAATPTGDYRLRIAELTVPQGRSAGAPPLTITAAGRLAGGRATLDATLAAARAATLTVRGSVPTGETGALDLAVAGRVDASLANRSFAAGGRTLAGTVVLDGRVTGPMARPAVAGTATLADGTFADAETGLRLDALTARLVARGDTLTLEQASATTRNGGPVSASGSVRLDAGAGFPGTVKITGRNARLLQSMLATAVLDLDLAVSGPLARAPRLTGQAAIVSLDVPVPERLPGRMQPLPGTRHRHPTPTAARRLALQAKAARRSGGTAGVALDLAITVPGQIWVHGRGLDAQLGGSLRLTGTSDHPHPVGAFSLRRGRLQVLTASLDFTRANLTFAGDLSPELDFVATTQAGGASVTIAITGQPSDPRFAFTSSPDLPQDEILSRLLFGAPAGQLSTTQALSLAAAAAQYSTGGGNDALEGLRRSLGLGAGGLSGNPLTNALGNRVSVGVHTGVTPAETGVGVDVTVFGPLKAKGAVNANGGTSVGLGAEHEW